MMEDYFVAAGMEDVSPSKFFLRVILIGGTLTTLFAYLYIQGWLDLAGAIILSVIPIMLIALNPVLNKMNLAAKLEKDLWAYLATLWLLQRSHRPLGESLEAAANITDDKDVKNYFRKAAARIKAAGTLEGLQANIRYSPSNAWKRLYTRLMDYFFTRGEAVDEMLETELHEAVAKTTQDMRRNIEMLMLILIIYVLTSTVFPFVITLLFTFQALISGFGGGGMNSLALLVGVLPSPMFILMFKILTPRYYKFDGESLAIGWGMFFFGFMAGLMATFYFPTLIPPMADKGMISEIVNSLRDSNIWLRLTFGLMTGGLMGWLAIRGRESRLRGEALDYPLFLQDLFVELKGGRAFCRAIEDMKASYKSLRDFMARVKYWAKLRVPYTDILTMIAERQRYSISKMSTLLIMNALKSGVELKEAFGTISSFMMKVREMWLEAEGEKRGNYITAVLSFIFSIFSLAILVRMLNIPISARAAEFVKGGLMLQGFVQALVMGLSLGAVRSGHLTSSFREIFLLAIPTLISLALIQAWSPPPLILGGH